jgi:hypothetical protein
VAGSGGGRARGTGLEGGDTGWRQSAVWQARVNGWKRGRRRANDIEREWMDGHRDRGGGHGLTASWARTREIISRIQSKIQVRTHR